MKREMIIDSSLYVLVVLCFRLDWNTTHAPPANLSIQYGRVS